MDERLVQACVDGRLDEVKQLLDQYEGEGERALKDEKGWSLLHHASRHGHLPIVELLLKRGYDHSVETRDKNTPLHLACSFNCEDVAIRLLWAMPQGAPPRANRQGNTPLHLACKTGSVRVVQALMANLKATYAPALGQDQSASLPKYLSTAYAPNREGITPFGYAVSHSHREIANMLLDEVIGSPWNFIKDLPDVFPTLKPAQRSALDKPVKIFVLGDRRCGKTTLIKSLQVEGKFFGISFNEDDVDHHRVGLIANEFHSRHFGRVILYDLASGRDCINDSLIQSRADIEQSVFIICVSLKDERKLIEERVLYWLYFIRHQCAQHSSPENKPNIVTVGSFGDSWKPFRSANERRLDMVYDKLKTQHDLPFNLLQTLSLNCQRSQSTSQLRPTLKKFYQQVRMSEELPSRCYILQGIMEAEFTDGLALQLSDLTARVSASSGSNVSPHTLLPQTAEGLLPLCEAMRDRNYLMMIQSSPTSTIDDTWIIHRQHQLVTEIDNALCSTTSDRSSGIFTRTSLQEALSSIPLEIDVLIQAIEHFKIFDPSARVFYPQHQSEDGSASEDEEPLFYLPALLPAEHTVQPWDATDTNYTFGFAWALTPPLEEFFLPRFLKLLLLSLFMLFKESGEYTHDMWSNGIHCSCQDEMEICIVIHSKAIILNMRCKQGLEVSCLDIRNQILNEIRAKQETLQPESRGDELIVPMDKQLLPLTCLDPNETHFNIEDLRKEMLFPQSWETQITSVQFLEPCVYLGVLEEPYRSLLTNPDRGSQAVSEEFIEALSRCFGDKWKAIQEYFRIVAAPRALESEVAQDSLSNDSDTPYASTEGGNLMYGRLFQQFESISLFQGPALREAIIQVSIQLSAHSYSYIY